MGNYTFASDIARKIRNLQWPRNKLSGQIGVVLGSFAPMHQGHLDLIMRAKKNNTGGCAIIVSGFSNDKGGDNFPLERRYRYVRELFANDPLVAVFCIDEDLIGIAEGVNRWDEWLAAFEIATCDFLIDPIYRWYVGELDYHKELTSRGYFADYIDRQRNRISASMIRQNPILHWNKITGPFKREYSTNILITGTASEGKSTLVQDLGIYFSAPASHEWAKDYILDSCLVETELDARDYIAFIEGQYQLNQQLINSPGNKGIFFSDTDPIITEMYAHYYALDPDFSISIDDFPTIQAAARLYASRAKWNKIFLLAPSDGFADDGVRYMEHSDIEIRNKMYLMLCEKIKECGDWDKVTILRGSYYDKFLTVKNYVEEIIKNGQN